MLRIYQPPPEEPMLPPAPKSFVGIRDVQGRPAVVEVVEGSDIRTPLGRGRYEWKKAEGARELAQEMFGTALIGRYEPDEVEAFAEQVVSRFSESGWDMRHDAVDAWLTEHRRKVFDEGLVWKDGRDEDDELPGTDWEYDWEAHGK
jgi:hypothetical protein